MPRALWYPMPPVPPVMTTVRSFWLLRSMFYAHTRYVEKHGLPASEAELAQHVFISHEDPTRAPFFAWLESVVPARNIVLRSGSQRVLAESLLAGIGVGFMPVFQAAAIPDLHEVMPPRRLVGPPVARHTRRAASHRESAGNLPGARGGR
ncbi:MAG: DNA-binding transcriptional LysR family regulator [Myxococcota bacterium]|jgi:DNA-binding transcriptional LysR family regulator